MEGTLYAMDGTPITAEQHAPTSPVSGAHEAMTTAEKLGHEARWLEAAEVLRPYAAASIDVRFRYHLAVNLACMQTHRPQTYAALTAVQKSGTYSIQTLPNGLATIAVRQPDGKLVSFSLSERPDTDSREIVKQLPEDGSAVALCGMGDGYCLMELMAHPPKLELEMEQPVYLLEPDPQAVMACLMIHDYTGPEGPLLQQRVQWFVGNAGPGEFARKVTSDVQMAFPTHQVVQGLHGKQMAELISALKEHLADLDGQYKRKVDAYYEGLAPEHFAQMLGEHPPRKPRVLLLTTRFSTVLQYSTRDAAEALEQLGFRARVLMEPTACHRISTLAMRKAMAEFLPDLVFQIDHLRHEHGDTFPARVPFVCWIQDHLPNLTTPAAGEAVGQTDFVMTGASYRYSRQYGYPREQCIDAGKPAKAFALASTCEGDGEELIYLSNRSQTIEQSISLVLGCSEDACTRELMAACCREMVRSYQDGMALPTPLEVERLVLKVEQQTDIRFANAEARKNAISILFDVLNNVLYRQQGLAWAAKYARERGVRLGVYGRGWEQHPEFAEFARGVVEHGEPLARLMRNSKINLQLEPYACYTHQRMLDGIMAGGFFLVRQHPLNVPPLELACFLKQHAPEAASVEQAKAQLSPALKEQFAALLARSEQLAGIGDPVEVVRCWTNAQILPNDGQALPDLDQVTFESDATFAARADRFLAEPQTRRSIMLAQRRAIVDRLTYAPLLKRVVGQIRHRLEENLSVERAA